MEPTLNELFKLSCLLCELLIFLILILTLLSNLSLFLYSDIFDFCGCDILNSPLSIASITATHAFFYA